MVITGHQDLVTLLDDLARVLDSTVRDHLANVD